MFQLVEEAVKGMLYPAVREKTPVPLVYERPVAELERRPRAVVLKSLMVAASWVPEWLARLR